MNFDMNFFEGFYLPMVVAFCLILGFILKKWISDESNKYIPTILVIVGAVLGCFVEKQITVESICYGAFSGLASTGMHQVFKQFIKNTEKKEE